MEQCAGTQDRRDPEADEDPPLVVTGEEQVHRHQERQAGCGEEELLRSRHGASLAPPAAQGRPMCSPSRSSAGDAVSLDVERWARDGIQIDHGNEGDRPPVVEEKL